MGDMEDSEKLIDLAFNAMGNDINYKISAAICVEDGFFLQEKSFTDAVSGGTVTDTGCRDVKIASSEEAFNGIFVRRSEYTIDDLEMRLTGNGVNDFAGFGAAIRAGGGSKVTINKANIETTGCVRPAIWVGEESEVVVNDSTIIAADGTLPKNYGWRFFGTPAPGSVLMECPWMLGILGNNRATVLTGSGKATYNNCHIRAENWGALGVDAVISGGELSANNCLIECTKSGYGAYADGDTLDIFSGCTFNAASYGLIMGGGSAVFKDNTIVNSRGIGVMSHDQGLNITQQGLGTLTIGKGCVFHTEGAVIQLKNVSNSIYVDGAELKSKSGLILEAMINDDPFNAEAAKHRGIDVITGEPMPPMLQNPKHTSSDGNDDIDATFKNVDLEGDMVNSMMEYSSMNIRFENSKITGAITTAAAVHDVGPNGESLAMEDDPHLYELIGKQTAAYAPIESNNGVTVSLNEKSAWTVNKTSYITGLDIAEDSFLIAPAGCNLHMEINGVRTMIKPGAYKGKISLIVTG